MIDYTKESKLNVNDYVILDVCNPGLAHKGLTINKQAGLILPCKIVVYSDKSKTKISLYLAMSKKAADEGDNDTARYFYNVAMDEARHAADFAILLGKVKDTRSNLFFQNCRKRIKSNINNDTMGG